MTVAKITSFAQIPAAAASVLGFTPIDSLVVLGLGGGPTARVDANMDLTEPLTGLLPAAPHWRERAPIVVLFGTGHDLSTLVEGWNDIMEVDVIDFLHVRQIDAEVRVTSYAQATTTVSDATGLDPEFAAKHVVATRDDLVHEAARVADADEAWTIAREAYFAGDGARAWVYLDRYVALNGRDDRSGTLASLLTDAIDPKSSAARNLLP